MGLLFSLSIYVRPDASSIVAQAAEFGALGGTTRAPTDKIAKQIIKMHLT
jgi:hypothetical protein